MPKDPKKNVDRYKISGGHLNEFEFHKNQEQFAEQQRKAVNNLIPGTPPEEKQILRKADQLAKKKPTKAVTIKGASAKKLAARKAAKK